MIFSNNKIKSVLGLFLSTGLLISCSENNSPQVKGANNSTFYVDALTAKFATVGEANAQGKQNKKLLSFEACLKDNAQTNSVSNIKFDIIAGDVAVTKTSDYRGCLLWNEIVEFEPDSEIKNIFMSRNVVATESHSGNEKLVFWVNPYKDQFEFNRQGSSGGLVNAGPVSYKLKDLSTASLVGYNYDIYVKINEDVNSLLSPIRRQAEVTTLRLAYRNIDYANIEVDSKMNLTFPFTYKTSLAMDLIRQDLGNITSEKIKRGNFLFNLVFLKEMTQVKNPKPADVVAAVQFTAKPRGDAGLIEVPINVKFGNIPALSSRMSVLLTITSLDTPALFADQNYEGVVNEIGANENLEIALIPNESNARDLVEKYTAGKARKPTKNIQAKQVLESEGFEEVLNPNVKYIKRAFFARDSEVIVNLAQVIQNLGENHELTADETKAVCAAYFQGKIQTRTDARYTTCLANPKMVLRAEIREFVEQVNSKPTNISFGRHEVLKISAIFELAQTGAKTSGYDLTANIAGNVDAGINASAKAGTGAGASAGIGVNIGLGGKAYTAKNFVKQEKDGKGVSITSTETVTSQPIAITLDIAAKKCLLIAPSADFVAKNRLGNLPSRYFCLKTASKGPRTEYFFLLNHQRVEGKSSVTDYYSPVVNPLRMLVRGQRPYEFLKGILSSEKYKYKLMVGMNADQVTEDPTSFMTQEVPLMLSSSRKVVIGPKSQ